MQAKLHDMGQKKNYTTYWHQYFLFKSHKNLHEKSRRIHVNLKKKIIVIGKVCEKHGKSGKFMLYGSYQVRIQLKSAV